jgi:hypothetical protein
MNSSETSDTRKVAVILPAFFNGGAELVTSWMLEILWRKYDLTLITLSTVDFEIFNRLYGTNLSPLDIKLEIPCENTFLPRLLTSRISLFTLRQHVCMRYVKRNL